MTTNEQLELGFNGPQSRLLGQRRELRMARGQWWFAKMRAVVAEAMDWSAPAEPRAEQLWMPGANRSLKA